MWLGVFVFWYSYKVNMEKYFLVLKGVYNIFFLDEMIGILDYLLVVFNFLNLYLKIK